MKPLEVINPHGSSDPLMRARTFLNQNAVQQNTWTRALCYLVFDTLLVVGLAWNIWLFRKDWDYWQSAPNYFNIFLLNQYILLALCIRFPVTNSFK